MKCFDYNEFAHCMIAAIAAFAITAGSVVALDHSVGVSARIATTVAAPARA